MNVVALSFADRRLLAARYDEHNNSHRDMRETLLSRGAADVVAKLDALRTMERAFDLDLGLVCHLYDHRADADRHPIEKMVVEFITDVHNSERVRDDAELLWILPDRVRQVRDLMQGHAVGDRE
jgi:hypothetical protein